MCIYKYIYILALAPVDVLGLVGLQTAPGHNGGQAGICGPKMRLFFSLGTEICERRLWKGASLPVGGFVG